MGEGSMDAENDRSQNAEPEGRQALTGDDLVSATQAIPDWEVVTQKNMTQLKRTFSFPDFVAALAFTNSVGELAEALDHHPRIVTEWGKVTVTWWSHDAGGVTTRDLRAAQGTDARYDPDAAD